MIRISMFICLFLLTATFSFSQTTYYVSSSQGNDNNPGTSDATPWKTISKVNSMKFLPGDNILFKRGDKWAEGAGLVINNSGTESNRIIFGAYGTGLKPVITLRQSPPGWNISGNWELIATNIWRIKIANGYTIGTQPTRLWLSGGDLGDGEEQLYAAGITSGDNLDGTFGINSAHRFCAQSTNGSVYVYATSNPATFYSNIEYPGKITSTGAITYHTIALIDADYVTIDGLDVRGGMEGAIGLGGSDYAIIKNCNIGKDSRYSGIYGNSQQITSNDPTSDYAVVESDTIYSGFELMQLLQYSSSSGIQWGILMTKATGWDIHNNFTKNWANHIGANAWLGETKNHAIHHNESTSTLGGGYPLELMGSVAYPNTSTDYYNNYCHDMQLGIQVAGSDNKLYYNVFTNYTTRVNSHGEGDGWGMQIITNGNDGSNPGNNYIFNNTWNDIHDIGILVQTNLGNYFYNNLFTNVGYVDERGLVIQTPKNVPDTWKNNLFFNSTNDGTGNMVTIANLGENTVSGFNGLNGQYNKTISGNLQHIGSLGALMNTNFTLPSESEALDAGISIESLVPEGFKDREGNLVDRANPNVGAIDNSAQESTGLQIYLQGTYTGGIMNTSLREGGLIPKSQPYNVSPWNYNGNESVLNIPSNIVDWILIELRTNISSSSIVAKRAGFVRNDGDIVDLDGRSKLHFDGVNIGNYYIVIQHRNHLSVMSSVQVPISGSSIQYDFTASRSSAYGNDEADLGSGKFGMYAGDGDANGIINVLDYSTVGNNLFHTGYLAGDLDLNGTVNVLDYRRTNQNLLKVSNVP